MMYYINSVSRLFFPVRLEDKVVKFDPKTGKIFSKSYNKKSYSEPVINFTFFMNVMREIYSNVESGELILYYTDRKKPITII